MEFNKLIMGSNYQSILLNYRQIIEVFAGNRGSYKSRIRVQAVFNEGIKFINLAPGPALHGMEPTDKILMNLKYDNKTVKTVKLLTENINEKYIRSRDH